MEKLHLPEIAFARGFSDPLEKRVVDTCRKLGLQAGRVTGSGTWEHQSGIEILRSKCGCACPGEIDCLAMTKDRRVAFVLECKVLRLSNTYGALRNVLGKLNSDDSDGFHFRLRKK